MAEISAAARADTGPGAGEADSPVPGPPIRTAPISARLSGEPLSGELVSGELSEPIPESGLLVRADASVVMISRVPADRGQCCALRSVDTSESATLGRFARSTLAARRPRHHLMHIHPA